MYSHSSIIRLSPIGRCVLHRSHALSALRVLPLYNPHWGSAFDRGAYVRIDGDLRRIELLLNMFVDENSSSPARPLVMFNATVAKVPTH